MRISISTFGLLTLAWLASPLRGQEKPAFTSTATVHDPAIVADAGKYYVFGSHLASASSTDLMNWTQISTGPTVGNALVPNPPVEFQEALTWAQTTTFWAPDVFKLPNGKYAFYYCACKGDSPVSALGLATSNSITGPYTNVKVFLKSGMWGQVSPDGRVYDATIHPNVVDPSLFYDATGQLWMVYGSYSGGIFIMTIDPATGLPHDGQGYGKKLIGGNHSTIEGPHIRYSPETKFYYFFMTYGGLDATGGYNIRMGRSTKPDGPYLDAAGNDLTNVKGAPGTLFDNASIAPYGVKLMGNWQFMHVAGETNTTSRGYVSPGGMQTTYDPATGKYVFSYHTRFVGRGEQHEVRTQQLYLNEDGWFVAAPHRYAGETITATDPNMVPGDYKLINHGKDITATVKTSTVVTLAGDGAISGTATGNWQLSGDYYCTLNVGGTTYKGVFATQWDDDNQAWVLTFSALSSSGVAIWGSRVTTPQASVAPTITRQPVGTNASLGQAVTLSVGVTANPAPAYQWKKDGVAIAGATRSSYTIASVAPTSGGSYTVTVTNSMGATTSSAAVVTAPSKPPQVVVPPGDATAQIINLSTRGIVATGDDVLVAGFVISGPAKKKLLIRAVGSNLRRFGLTGVIARPHLKVYTKINGTETVIAENFDWQTGGAALDAAVTSTNAFPFIAATETGYGDAALVISLDPGVYSTVVAPATTSANQDGIGLVEIYDVTPGDGSRLINISSRGRVETGARQMNVGVSVSGTGKARLLIRGIGPTLQALGLTTALSNPSLALYQSQAVVASNDDWWNSAQADQIVDISARLQAFGLGAFAADAVMLLRLDTGTYSAIISPSGSQSGVALAEIYEAPAP